MYFNQKPHVLPHVFFVPMDSDYEPDAINFLRSSNRLFFLRGGEGYAAQAIPGTDQISSPLTYAEVFGS